MKKAKIVKHLLLLANEVTMADSRVLDKYPKLYAAISEEMPESMCSWSGYQKAKNKPAHLMKCAIYFILAAYGPDVQFSGVGKVAAKLRRRGVNILREFETGSLYSTLARMGYFGKKSDELRDQDDKVYNRGWDKPPKVRGTRDVLGK